MNTNPSEFENAVRQQINSSIESIDALTQSQLTQARYKALSSTKKERNWFMPLLSTAVVALLLIAILPDTSQKNTVIDLATTEELILVSEMEEIDLYDDIEFYQWLETIDNNS
ncbi:MAG: hypothetical protein GQ475_00825 [Methylococcaceae bacterium]|nr:hypothetical protein [Methylococcaceae bacterium]